jgi:sterol desaturase/sphingolipid hydroxylase (fatty acid hydroxylase superfamily)
MTQLIANIILMLPILVPGLIIEAAFPLRPINRSKLAFGALYAIVLQVLLLVISPTVAVLSSLVTSTVAGSLIVLPGGAWFPVSLAIYLLSAEFLEYWWHRAEHKIPVLWTVHSFHHSEEHLNVLTTWRAFWLAGGPLTTLILYTPVALVFRAPHSVLAAMGAIRLLSNLLMHLNTRIEFGRFSFWFTGPQFHRIHHSIEERHWNKNFAPALPIWDIVFGTAWKPARGEFPETGLQPNFTPGGILEALLWPARFIRYRDAVLAHPASVRTQPVAKGAEPLLEN